MNNNPFSKFTPKESKFFPLLKSMSDILLSTCDLIIECVQVKDHESATEFYKQIKEKEKESDEISSNIFDELNSTFITPFDREDINVLANRLDDVTDHINSCAKRIALYNPKSIPDSALELANLVKEAASCINMAVDELDVLNKNRKKVNDYCKELHDIEHKGDDIYDNFVVDLFENAKDSIEVTKMKEIMNELEEATDSAKYVGEIIKTMIVKYA